MAILVVKATIADAEKRDTEVIALLTEAAAKDDRLAYDEPSDWFFPVRHELGAALLRSGKTQEAEAVYREDLRRHPDNGWALYGLVQSLTAQHKDADARVARQRFDKAWSNADVVLTTSAYYWRASLNRLRLRRRRASRRREPRPEQLSAEGVARALKVTGSSPWEPTARGLDRPAE